MALFKLRVLPTSDHLPADDGDLCFNGQGEMPHAVLQLLL